MTARQGGVRVDRIAVLVVEDDEVAAAAHAMYVERVPGFTVEAVAHSAQQATRLLGSRAIDLVLLDMGLPDRPGLSVVQNMRAAGHRADVIAVTSAREVAVVRAAVSLGIVQYILKPFVFATLRERLEAYLSYRARVAEAVVADTQGQVDSMFTALHSGSATPLPKGMSEDLFTRTCAGLRDAAEPLSSSELGLVLGVSRVTARRYGEHLVAIGRARRGSRYAGAGRPEVTYAWTG